MFEIIMPKAGMAMEEGTIVQWLKKEGEKVKKGEDLVTIETNKITMEEPSPSDGILLKIVKKEGEVVPVTEIIAYVGQEGEEILETINKTNKEKFITEATFSKKMLVEDRNIQKDDKIPATPAAKMLAKSKNIDLSKINGTGECGAIKKEDVEKYTIKATPLAKKIAEQKNIDLNDIQGSGANGKITKKDLITENNSELKDKRVPITGIKKVIFEQMSKGHSEVPSVTTTVKANVDKLLELRKEINQQFNSKISINDLILKAAANALQEYPKVNASIDESDLVFKKDINVGFAVGMDEDLIVPVIRNINSLNLIEISNKTKDLIDRARANKISLDEISGGTFTVSNMGMYGVTNFTPIVNVPEIAILGVCAIEESSVVIEGEIITAKYMNLCLTYDHRALNGVNSTIFLNKIKEQIEKPFLLLMSNTNLSS